MHNQEKIIIKKTLDNNEKIIIDRKELNFLLSVLDRFVFINLTENDKDVNDKLKVIYDNLNKIYLFSK